MFVEIDSKKFRRWGIGKLDGVKGTTATVTFFDSPVVESVKVEVPTEHLREIQLSAQTRVYWQDEGDATWRVGRVRHQDGEDAVIRFPNRDDRILSLDDIYVRWDRPILDPTDYLAEKLSETPLFAEARGAFMRGWVEQRGAAQGMSALVSSVIDLEAHQVEVVRRVLQDPVQRYLLADEVGLGKTIEAGVLIRQYVIDQPDDHNIVVIVPPGIVAQWRDELTKRFLLGPHLDTTVHVVSLAESLVQLSRLAKQAGMLVIDEAHHLSRDPVLYDGLREAITTVPRLLLLSATPVLGNESGFLAMLHLLDPLLYPLDQQKEFGKRIEYRQSLAETVAGLIPENVLQIDFYLDELDELFQHDELLHHRIGVLRAVLDELPDETDPKFLDALYTLRAHVSETYRLDRRILRNRRRAVPGLTPCRSGVDFVDYSSGAAERLVFAMEEWRSHSAAEVYGKENSSDGKHLAKWFSEFVASLASDRERAAEQIEDRIKNLTGPGSTGESGLLKTIWTQLQESALDRGRYSALADFLGVGLEESANKYVVFCSSVSAADDVTDFLRRRGITGVDRYGEFAELEEDELSCSKFLEDPTHRILVCDRHAEEGLNLQGGSKVVVHVDLPLEPNRIEQRLGRVDRYGSGSAVKSVALRCTDDPFDVAWCQCLNNGLGIFDSSTASLQYLIEQEMSNLQDALLTEGIEAISSLTKKMGGNTGLVEAEMRRIDDQDALDALATPPEETMDRLIDVDSDWLQFQENVHHWFVQTLQLGKLEIPTSGHLPSGDSIVRYQLRRGDQGPETLIPLRKFVGEFLSVLDFDAPGASSKNLLTFPYTCRRATALSQRSRTENVRLLRYGEEFLEGLNAITSIDDRGRSVGMWRCVNRYKSDERADIFIKFHFIVETDVAEAADCYADAGFDVGGSARPALTRRGDMLFTPFFQSIWLDGGLNVVVDEDILHSLSQPYNPRDFSKGYCDTNINNQRWPFLAEMKLPVIEYWSEWVLQARKAAENAVRSDFDLGVKCEAALNRARSGDFSRFAQLQTRIDGTDGAEKDGQKEFLALERSVAELLYSGIAIPKITLDTIMAVFLSVERFPATGQPD